LAVAVLDATPFVLGSWYTLKGSDYLLTVWYLLYDIHASLSLPLYMWHCFSY
jgi:hypothetical protein